MKRRWPEEAQPAWRKLADVYIQPEQKTENDIDAGGRDCRHLRSNLSPIANLCRPRQLDPSLTFSFIRSDAGLVLRL